jgi:hypothetical protein
MKPLQEGSFERSETNLHHFEVNHFDPRAVRTLFCSAKRAREKSFEVAPGVPSFLVDVCRYTFTPHW